METVFVNPERCIGCLQCELACAVEHSVSHDGAVAFLETPIPRKRVHVEPGPMFGLSFPNRCRHCDPAPCLGVCPTAAITRDVENGVVLVNPKRCIGCAMCAVVCPFDVLTFYPLADGPGPATSVAVKCDGCVERLNAGEEPACSEVCKVDALVFGELNELVAAGRLRQTGAVLAATAQTLSAPNVPDPLAGWRQWGEAMASAADAAGEVNRRSASPGARQESRLGSIVPETTESEGGPR
ncbi:MAG TPA: 4Fe-4S dicluster domain-containing protein [Acidimicrobiales bacterium]|nr:4Fe-4S dicluster domain-containing protein [Acidimicrobiales bacterium]